MVLLVVLLPAVPTESLQTPDAKVQEKTQAEQGWEAPDRQLLEKIRPWMQKLQDPPMPDGLVVLPQLAWGDAVEANRLILKAEPYYKGEPKEVWGFWDLFEMIHAWMLYHDKLTDPARNHIRQAFREALAPGQRILRRDFGYHNVNHPLSCTALGVVGGEQFDRLEVAEISYRKLDRLAQRWSEMGSYSEYNSPTYQCVDFVALATIHMFSRNAEAARKAKILEERLWLETASRYHTATWTLAGPHSRAYYWDTAGGAADMQYIFHRVLGPEVPLWIHITNAHYHLDHRLTWAGRAASLTFSCPDYLREVMRHPPVPYQFRATTRSRSGPSDLTTLLADNFSLGSSRRQYGNGAQNENLIAYWRKRKPVRKHEDIRSLFMRYGDHFCHQDGSQAIVVGRPRGGKNVERLALQIFVTLYDELDETRCGGGRKADATTTTPGELIALRDGLTYVAIQPLAGSNVGTKDSVRVTPRDNVLEIALLNYEGPRRNFSREELRDVYHGFCIQLANASDYECFDTFCQLAKTWRVSTTVDEKGVCSIEWEGGNKPLSMRLDLRVGKVLDRKVSNQPLSLSMLASPLVQQETSGEIAVGDAVLETDEGVPAYLYADPGKDVYVGVNPTNKASPLRLTTPAGTVSVESLGFGKVELFGGKAARLCVEAVTLDGKLSFRGAGEAAAITVNGREVTARKGDDGRTRILLLRDGKKVIGPER